jgi:hypothetical protein
MNEETFNKIKDLFRETAKAHHQAYIETNGYHPDWPIWYAEKMHEELTQILRAKFTKSELIYLLVLVDKEQVLNAPGAYWPGYYAKFFMERYLP